ncbi:hypothetical protein WP50_29380, partial [Lactiplantibacillus plantarum]
QINAQMRFRSNTIPQSERLLSPTNQWQIEVHDTRSVASKWYVYATATKMKSAQHSLIGDLVYIVIISIIEFGDRIEQILSRRMESKQVSRFGLVIRAVLMRAVIPFEHCLLTW